MYYMDPSGEDFMSFITSPAFNSGLQTTQRYTNTVGNLLSFGQFEAGFQNAANTGNRLANEGVNPVSTLHSVGELGFGIGRTAIGGVATGGTLGELKLLAGSLFGRSTQEQKFVPNPYGKKGGPEHQAVQNAKYQELKNSGYGNLRTEVKIDTPFGQKTSRYAGVGGTNPSTGQMEYFQVGRALKDGTTPVARERSAISDILQAQPKSKVEFLPYNR